MKSILQKYTNCCLLLHAVYAGCQSSGIEHFCKFITAINVKFFHVQALSEPEQLGSSLFGLMGRLRSLDHVVILQGGHSLSVLKVWDYQSLGRLRKSITQKFGV